MLTLDAIKEKIRQIDEINKTLEELNNCPDPLNKPFCNVAFRDGGSIPVDFLSNRVLKKVISIGIKNYQRELFNELTTLMDEIQCTNSIISVDSQSTSNQTTTEDVGK